MPACAIRTAVSAGPPGGNGTMILIGLDGKRLGEGAARQRQRGKRTRPNGSERSGVWSCRSSLTFLAGKRRTPTATPFQSEIVACRRALHYVAADAYLHS